MTTTPAIERAAQAMLVIEHDENADLYEPHLSDAREVLDAALDVEEMAQAIDPVAFRNQGASGEFWRDVARDNARAVRTTILGEA